MKKAKKPPSGLMPEILFEEHRAYERLQDISNAICRYADAKMLIPNVWADELAKRLEQYSIMVKQFKRYDTLTTKLN